MPKNDHKAIQMLEELRANGADWLGIVKDAHGQDKKRVWQQNRTFVDYVERTYERVESNPRWVVHHLHAREGIADALQNSDGDHDPGSPLPPAIPAKTRIQ
jgi:hypothetical protein